MTKPAPPNLGPAPSDLRGLAAWWPTFEAAHQHVTERQEEALRRALAEILKRGGF